MYIYIYIYVLYTYTLKSAMKEVSSGASCFKVSDYLKIHVNVKVFTRKSDSAYISIVYTHFQVFISTLYTHTVMSATREVSSGATCFKVSYNSKILACFELFLYIYTYIYCIHTP